MLLSSFLSQRWITVRWMSCRARRFGCSLDLCSEHSEICRQCCYAYLVQAVLIQVRPPLLLSHRTSRPVSAPQPVQLSSHVSFGLNPQQTIPRYQNIWMYVIHELEDAIGDCNIGGAYTSKVCVHKEKRYVCTRVLCKVCEVFPRQPTPSARITAVSGGCSSRGRQTARPAAVCVFFLPRLKTASDEKPSLAGRGRTFHHTTAANATCDTHLPTYLLT